MSTLPAFNGIANPEAYVPRVATDQCLRELQNWIFTSSLPVALVSGPSGIGKTLMLRILAVQTEGRFESVYIPNPIFAPREISLWVLDALKVPLDENPEAALVRTAANLKREGSGLLLLIDDAELLPSRTQKWLFDIGRGGEGAPRMVLSVMDDDRRDQLLAAAGADAADVRLETPMTAGETANYVRAALQHAALSPEQWARFDERTLVELFERSGGLPLRVDHEAAALLREDFELGQGGSRSLSLGAQIVSVGGAGSEEALPRDPDPPAGPLHALGDLQAEVAGPPPERRPAPPFSRPRRRAVESAWVQLGLAFVAGIAVTIGIGTLGGSEPAQVAVAPQPEAQVDIPIPALEPSPRVVRAASEPAPLIRDEVPELVPPLAEEAPEIVPAETAAVVLEAPHEETTAPPVEVAAVVPEPEEPIAPVVAPTPLLIDLNARPWASISIDGVEVGETPLAEVPVLPGLHRFAATLPDGSVVEREIEIGPNNRHIVF